MLLSQSRSQSPEHSAAMAGPRPMGVVLVREWCATVDQGGTGNLMTSRDELKRAVCEVIDHNGNEIIELGERILHHPETGFNEDKTAALVAERMRTLGLEPQENRARPCYLSSLRGLIEPRNCSTRRQSKSSCNAPLSASPVGSAITAHAIPHKVLTFNPELPRVS
jgi:hypothetical protein